MEWLFKQCSECREAKNLSDFYKHPKTADGYLPKCKVCHKRLMQKNRASKLDYYRKFDRERGCRQTPEQQQAYRERNPKKRAAHVWVGNAVRDGRLRPRPCETCGAVDVHGHHDDYDFPTSVRWLCAVHHKEWHLENGEGANAH